MLIQPQHVQRYVTLASVNNSPAQFDRYAQAYTVALETTRSATGENTEFFARGRIRWLSQCVRVLLVEQPRTVLDFGCGTGSSMPILSELLACESLVGIDVSEKCIEHARNLHASIGVRFDTVSAYRPSGDMDLVYSNGVFHHILPAERDSSLRLVYDSLRPGGLFSFWENNPWNLGTRYCMYRCIFDEDAVTISPWQARSLLRAAGFELVRQDFLFYFPALLKWLRDLEPFLAKLPLGGQYQVLCRKPL